MSCSSFARMNTMLGQTPFYINQFNSKSQLNLWSTIPPMAFPTYFLSINRITPISRFSLFLRQSQNHVLVHIPLMHYCDIWRDCYFPSSSSASAITLAQQQFPSNCAGLSVCDSISIKSFVCGTYVDTTSACITHSLPTLHCCS